MNTIKLQLTLEETNLILNALGDQPYKQVFQLIQSLQQQAAQQIESENNPDVSKKNGKSKIKQNGQLVN